MNPDEIVIGISSCLMGEAVRYDGGHKLNRTLIDKLADHFSFRSFCPEVAIGLGVPRPPIQLVKSGDEIRVRGVNDPKHDVTDTMRDHAGHTLEHLRDISGYVFKQGSPSCGIRRVKVYDVRGAAVDEGRGLFAQVVIDALPELPVEEEGRLIDPILRQSFISRVIVYHRRKCRVAVGPIPED